MSGINSAKLALRKEMKNIIKQLSCEEKQRQSKRIFEKVSVFKRLSNQHLASKEVMLQLKMKLKGIYNTDLRCLPQYQESKRISLYLSTNDEVDTLPILKHIFEAGKEVYVPRYKGKEMEMVKLISMEDYEKLPLTKWNIKQPDSKDMRENALETGGLDLILLPGVAFTINGKRLGHGMGYYDRFLKCCFEKQQKRPHLIAIAFNEQIKEDIPMTENDVPLDTVLTEKCT